MRASVRGNRSARSYRSYPRPAFIALHDALVVEVLLVARTDE